jgi:hypothetical protein
MRALSSKRIKINLEYDQKRSLMISAPETAPDLHLSKSTPPFAALSASDTHGVSKVFVKRDYLYNEMKNITVSVDHCASMWLLEDFLRSRIKSPEDVAALKK